MKNKYYVWVVFLGLLMIACEPAVDDKIDIGSPPVPSFEIEPGESPNDFILRNTTEGAFITHWDLGTAGTAEGEIVDARFSKKGAYDVKMTTFNKGGSASVTKILTVEEDAPLACEGIIELLTACDQKVWKLAQEESAIHVGPNLTETWWGNSTGDLAERECHFNDEYIFKSTGVFEYDNKGDFWADTDGSGNIWPADLGLSPGCQSSDSWPEKYQSWDSGIHAFVATEDKLTVIGEGAWIGLYKIGSSSEVDQPQSSVEFNISEISANRMVLFTDYGGLVWRLTLESN